MDFKTLVEQSQALDWALLSVLTLSLLVQLYYYLVVYTAMIRHRPAASGEKSRKGVSVVVCARNEAERLEKFLPSILEQDHPDFELVVVNDASGDRTEEVLSAMSVKYDKLRFTSVPEGRQEHRGKKLALTLGLKAARHERVLLTDADCYPAGRDWLSNMTEQLDGQKEIVLGYGAYERKRGLLNLLIRYETAFTAIQYLSFALKGKAYMGVGRNLAYNKSLFFGSKGFSRHYHIASGDDDLFVNEHANKGNVAVEYRTESHTYSLPEEKLTTWIRQKKRHVSAGKMYSRKSRFRLAMELSSRMAFYISFSILAVMGLWLWPILMLMALFQLVRMSILKLGMVRLREKFLLLPSLLFDPALPLILGMIWLSNISVTKYQQWS